MDISRLTSLINAYCTDKNIDTDKARAAIDGIVQCVRLGHAADHAARMDALSTLYRVWDWVLYSKCQCEDEDIVTLIQTIDVIKETIKQ